MPLKIMLFFISFLGEFHFFFLNIHKKKEEMVMTFRLFEGRFLSFVKYSTYVV